MKVNGYERTVGHQEIVGSKAVRGCVVISIGLILATGCTTPDPSARTTSDMSVLTPAVQITTPSDGILLAYCTKPAGRGPYVIAEPSTNVWPLALHGASGAKGKFAKAQGGSWSLSLPILAYSNTSDRVVTQVLMGCCVDYKCSQGSAPLKFQYFLPVPIDLSRNPASLDRRGWAMWVEQDFDLALATQGLIPPPSVLDVVQEGFTSYDRVIWKMPPASNKLAWTRVVNQGYLIGFIFDLVVPSGATSKIFVKGNVFLSGRTPNPQGVTGSMVVALFEARTVADTACPYRYGQQLSNAVTIPLSCENNE